MSKIYILCGYTLSGKTTWSGKQNLKVFNYDSMKYDPNRNGLKMEVFMEQEVRKYGGDCVLDHTSWRCQYHIVFAPKYRRQVIYREIKVDIGKILRKLCDQKGVEIIEAELCPDHVHMLVSIPPKYSVSQIMGYLKGKSSLMIFQKYGNLKYKYGNRHFWARGYYVDTVGRNKKQVQEYIKHQLDEDQIADQMSLKEYIDPFTGSENKKA